MENGQVHSNSAEDLVCLDFRKGKNKNNEPTFIKSEPLDECPVPLVTPVTTMNLPVKTEVKKGRPPKVKQEVLTDKLQARKKRDRFNGKTEEEVLNMTLPDHLVPNLDIVIIGINPGLTAAYIGHHYAGPGNHFYALCMLSVGNVNKKIFQGKCLFLSGLIPQQMNAYDDDRLKEYGIGFTNIVSRTSRGSADLTRKEIKEGAEILAEKIQKCKPKIAVFNGKGIYEVFCGHKNFVIGKQPEPFPGTDTVIFVMPSSSARCSQLPRAVDKVPFYAALKKLRDYLRGDVKDFDESEVVFPDLELKVEPKKEKIIDGELKTEADGEPATKLKKETKAKKESAAKVKLEGGAENKTKKGRKAKGKDLSPDLDGDDSGEVGNGYQASVSSGMNSQLLSGTDMNSHWMYNPGLPFNFRPYADVRFESNSPNPYSSGSVDVKEEIPDDLSAYGCMPPMAVPNGTVVDLSTLSSPYSTVLDLSAYCWQKTQSNNMRETSFNPHSSSLISSSSCPRSLSASSNLKEPFNLDAQLTSRQSSNDLQQLEREDEVITLMELK